MLIAEVTSKVLTIDQQRIAALKRNAEQARQTLQAEKDRQKLANAQKKLRLVQQSFTANSAKT